MLTISFNSTWPKYVAVHSFFSKTVFHVIRIPVYSLLLFSGYLEWRLPTFPFFNHDISSFRDHLSSPCPKPAIFDPPAYLWDIRLIVGVVPSSEVFKGILRTDQDELPRQVGEFSFPSLNPTLVLPQSPAPSDCLISLSTPLCFQIR